jgi:hypothetical protein
VQTLRLAEHERAARVVRQMPVLHTQQHATSRPAGVHGGEGAAGGGVYRAGHKITYDEVMAAIAIFARTGDSFMQKGSERMRDLMYAGDTREELWRQAVSSPARVDRRRT